MRVSVIPELFQGTCKCGRTGDLYVFTLSVGLQTETSQPICPVCLDTEKEVAVDIAPPPPPTAGPPSKRVKMASKRNERLVAEGVGARVQPGSGNQPGAKGDSRLRGKLRIENKDSYSNQFILRLAVLHKIMGECGPGEKPAVVVTFMEPHTHRPRERWSIIPHTDWEEYVNAAGTNR
jgi:hypothetical protein